MRRFGEGEEEIDAVDEAEAEVEGDEGVVAMYGIIGNVGRRLGEEERSGGGKGGGGGCAKEVK